MRDPSAKPRRTTLYGLGTRVARGSVSMDEGDCRQVRPSADGW